MMDSDGFGPKILCKSVPMGPSLEINQPKKNCCLMLLLYDFSGGIYCAPKNKPCGLISRPRRDAAVGGCLLCAPRDVLSEH